MVVFVHFLMEKLIIDTELKEKLTGLDFSKFDLSRVTDFGYAFHGLEYLKTITFPTNKLTRPKRVEGMFSGCAQLTSVDLSMFDLSDSDCDDFNDIFYRCLHIYVLILHDFNFKNENLVENMLTRGYYLEYLDIYNAKGATETIKNYAGTSKSLKVCQSEYIIPSKIPVWCDKYVGQFVCSEKPIESDNTINSTIPSLISNISNVIINIQISDNQDINPSNQNTNDIISSDDLGTDLKNQIRTTGILDDIKILSETNEINDTNKYITESNILTNDLAIKTSSSIVDTEFISLTNENNNKYSTSANDNIDEKTNSYYSEESDTSIIDEKKATTSKVEIQESEIHMTNIGISTISRLDTEEITTSKLDNKKPITSELSSEESTT